MERPPHPAQASPARSNNDSSAAPTLSNHRTDKTILVRASIFFRTQRAPFVHSAQRVLDNLDNLLKRTFHGGRQAFREHGREQVESAQFEQRHSNEGPYLHYGV